MQRDALTIEYAAHRIGLRVEVRGLGNYANTLTYWHAIGAQLHALHPRGLLLIDRTHGAPLSAEEWQTLVEAIGLKELDQVRIAHVKPQGLQRIEYCEIHAREAGIDARVFEDEGEADLWLRYGERSAPD